MSAKNWCKEGVVYQIYPLSFMDSNGDGIGDLKGITSKVDYLKDLGITIVWLSPIYASPMDDNGYDIADYKAINPMFGTMEDFDEILETFHKAGIKVIMDLVCNHTSDEHYWFKEACKSKDNPYHDYYFFQEKPNNWLSFFSGSAWEYNKPTNEYYLHLFSRKQPDLNWENPKVREEIKSVLKFWLDKGVDGFRCDVINLISKTPGLPDGDPAGGLIGNELYINGPRLHEYLQELNDDVFSKYDCFTVGECCSSTPELAIALDGKLDMIFQFDHLAIDNNGNKWLPKKFKFSDMKYVLSKWQYALNEKSWVTLFFENHDQPRSVSRFGNEEFRTKSAMLLATYMFLQRGTPFIYQGEELGMTNPKFSSIEDYKDVETINMYKYCKRDLNLTKQQIMKSIQYIGRDNARTPMQWDESENAGFTTGTPWIKLNPNYKDINVKKDIASKDSIINYYKELLTLRKEYSTLIYGKYEGIWDSEEEILLYTRSDEKYTFYIVCNPTNEKKKINLIFNVLYSELVLDNYLLDLEDDEFYPYQCKVFKLDTKNQ